MTEQEFEEVMSIENPYERVKAWFSTEPGGVFYLRHTAWSLRLSTKEVSTAIRRMRKDGWCINNSNGRGQNVAWRAWPPGVEHSPLPCADLPPTMLAIDTARAVLHILSAQYSFKTWWNTLAPDVRDETVLAMAKVL